MEKEMSCMSAMEKVCKHASSVHLKDLSKENQMHVSAVHLACQSMDLLLDPKSSSSTFQADEGCHANCQESIYFDDNYAL